MRKLSAALCSVLVAVCLLARLSSAESKAKKDEKPAAAAKTEKAETKADKAEAKEETKAEPAKDGEAPEAPEVIKMEKTGKLAPVNFPHKTHAEKVEGGCATCHEGEKPTFAKKRSEEGMKMADMYAGKTCGACHDGKKAFAAKGGCMKCHKKEAK